MKKSKTTLRQFGIASFCLLNSLFFNGCLGRSQLAHLDKAEELRKDGKCEQAIPEYRLYLDWRLSEKQKSINPDLNPRFYHLLIGDCYLRLNEPDKARKEFLSAKEAGIDPSLVSSKLRDLAQWYENRQEYETAIQILTEFYELDPSRFDIELDRNHKALINKLDNKPDSAPSGIRQRR